MKQRCKIAIFCAKSFHTISKTLQTKKISENVLHHTWDQMIEGQNENNMTTESTKEKSTLKKNTYNWGQSRCPQHGIILPMILIHEGTVTTDQKGLTIVYWPTVGYLHWQYESKGVITTKNCSTMYVRRGGPERTQITPWKRFNDITSLISWDISEHRLIHWCFGMTAMV